MPAVIPTQAAVCMSRLGRRGSWTTGCCVTGGVTGAAATGSEVATGVVAGSDEDGVSVMFLSMRAVLRW
ncbi:hypothetical protein OKHIL_17640 [Mycolicibacterium mageritense]